MGEAGSWTLGGDGMSLRLRREGEKQGKKQTVRLRGVGRRAAASRKCPKSWNFLLSPIPSRWPQLGAVGGTALWGLGPSPNGVHLFGRVQHPQPGIFQDVARSSCSVELSSGTISTLVS